MGESIERVKRPKRITRYIDYLERLVAKLDCPYCAGRDFRAERCVRCAEKFHVMKTAKLSINDA